MQIIDEQISYLVVKNTLKYLVGKKNISTFAPAKVRIALARELTIP